MRQGHRFLIGALVVVALAAALALLASGGRGVLAAPGIIYVDTDATGANTGTSWEDAYTDLQLALDAVSVRQEIWVAEGVYTPSQEFAPGDPRSATFQMKNEVALYGGFDPTVNDIEFGDRDWEANPTILSGDIGSKNDPSDNSYHVFYHPSGTDLDASAILDGFTISGGNANGGAWPHWDGGGMYNDSSSPTLTNCTFEGNLAPSASAGSGGGMYNTYSSPTLTNCTFEGNYASYNGGGMFNYRGSSPTLTDCTFAGNSVSGSDTCFMGPCGGGGGLYNYYETSPTLTNCTFSGNSAMHNGGGMYNFNSLALTNCTFSDNEAGDYGGGMYNVGASLTLTGCTFEGNEAGDGTSYDGQGGGMYSEGGSSTLTDCIFSGNSAGSDGGGMYDEGGSLTLTGCTFEGNEAGHNGGGMYNFRSRLMLTNCIFSGNSASGDGTPYWGSGGGMYNLGLEASTLTGCTFSGNLAEKDGGGMYNTHSSPVLTNCTFSGNSAATFGGGMYNDYEFDTSPTLTNCILRSDVPDEIYNYDLSSAAVVTYSDIEGGYEGEGNFDTDPLFVDANNGDFHLLPGSPCIDAGNNDAPGLPEYDFEGDARILDGDGDGTAIVDMGVDEYAPGGPAPMAVEIDIKPKTASNVIKLGSGGAVPVAILTTDEFDAGDANPDSVLFAGAAPLRLVVEDADRDGDADLVLYFKIQALEIDEFAGEITLTGETFAGAPIEGTDTVRIIP